MPPRACGMALPRLPGRPEPDAQGRHRQQSTEAEEDTIGCETSCERPGRRRLRLLVREPLHRLPFPGCQRAHANQVNQPEHQETHPLVEPVPPGNRRQAGLPPRGGDERPVALVDQQADRPVAIDVPSLTRTESDSGWGVPFAGVPCKTPDAESKLSPSGRAPPMFQCSGPRPPVAARAMA